MPIPNIKLNDGNKMPSLGLGLWQVSTYNQLKLAFDAAVKSGYTLFDSAQIYKNEEFLGRAIKESRINRKDLFITTKIAIYNFGRKKTLKSFEESLEKLDMDYVDLILLHFPITLFRRKAYLALEEIKKSGKAKSIGVSNYTIRHLELLKKYANIIPAVNQVELHVFLQQPKLVDYCRENNIVLEAYSPLAHGKKMNNETINKIAKKYNKTYSQIMIRFLIEQGYVVIPKSVNAKRIKENIDVFDFKLDNDDINNLRSLDENFRVIPNPSLIP